MKKAIKGHAMTIPGGLAFGAAVEIVMTILFSGMIARFIDKGILPMGQAGYAVMILLSATSFIGAIITAAKIKHRILMVTVESGILYLLILLSITALFFGGQYAAVGETGLVVSMGTAAGAVTCLSRRKKYQKRK